MNQSNQKNLPVTDDACDAQRLLIQNKFMIIVTSAPRERLFTKLLQQGNGAREIFGVRHQGIAIKRNTLYAKKG